MVSARLGLFFGLLLVLALPGYTTQCPQAYPNAYRPFQGFDFCCASCLNLAGDDVNCDPDYSQRSSNCFNSQATACPGTPPCQDYVPPPTEAPTDSPTDAPSYGPSTAPSLAPSYSPTTPTHAPTNAPTRAPTNAPTVVSGAATLNIDAHTAVWTGFRD